MPVSTTLERDALVILSHITEPGDMTAGRLVREYGAVATVALIADNATEIERVRDVSDFIQRVRPRYSKEILGVIMEMCARAGIRTITPEDIDWPDSVADLGDAQPHVLYVRSGEAYLDWSKAHSVAIVGARAATSYGENVAIELASDLARDHIIVSGAAYGIDGAAHRATLASGGMTIALLAGGIDRPYPAGHADLIARIARSGAVMSEVPPGSAPTKWRFLARNRIIAAISQASVVVEAGYRSGSLNEAGHAASLGRPVGAVPGPITSAASAGCHRLIAQLGAKLVTSADDIRTLTGATIREVSPM